MTAVLAWLLGSKAGRITVAVLLGAAAVGLTLWRAFAKGKAAEQAKQAQASLEVLRSRVKTDDTIARMSVAGRRERLRQWSRD